REGGVAAILVGARAGQRRGGVAPRRGRHWLQVKAAGHPPLHVLPFTPSGHHASTQPASRDIVLVYPPPAADRSWAIVPSPSMPACRPCSSGSRKRSVSSSDGAEM